MEIRIDKAHIEQVKRRKCGEMKIEWALFLTIGEELYSFKLAPLMANNIIALAGIVDLNQIEKKDN